VRPVPGGPAVPGPIAVPPARAGGVSGPAAPPAADVPATRAPDVLQAASSQNTSAPQVARTSPVATPDPQTVFAAHDSARESGPSAIFALCGAEPAALAATLDVIAGSAAELAVADLWDLARNLAAVARRTAERNATLRVTVTAATPGQLAVRARHAAQWLRGRAINGVVLEPGISLSAGAAGRAVIVFPGLASTAAGHAALLAGSLGALTTLDRLGITAVSAVGYSLGEIAGLVWAGCLPPAEAARLASLHGRILQGCASPAAATARVTATSALARQLCAQDDLHIAAYEAPSSHLLTGSGDGIRSLVRRGAADGIPVEVLAGTSGLHSPALARCVAPLRTVLAATPLAPPGRRLVSTITGQIVTAADDIAALLTSQLTSPVLFAQAMAEAAARADLIIVAGQQPGLTSFAAAAGSRPAITLPPASSMTAGRAAASSTTTARRTTAHGPAASGTAQAEVIAALFAAGAVDDLAPFLRTRQQEPELMTWAVPPMRNGSQDGVQGPGAETTGRYEKWRQKSSARRPKSAS
jgi:enediyne polyketide synthase